MSESEDACVFDLGKCPVIPALARQRNKVEQKMFNKLTPASIPKESEPLMAWAKSYLDIFGQERDLHCYCAICPIRIRALRRGKEMW